MLALSGWVDAGMAGVHSSALLREQLGNDAGSHVLAELMDPGNLTLFREQPVEVFVTPQIVSRILAQVALRPELGPVFDELFGPSGAEIDFHPAAEYGLGGRTVNFREVQAAASSDERRQRTSPSAPISAR